MAKRPKIPNKIAGQTIDKSLVQKNLDDFSDDWKEEFCNNIISLADQANIEANEARDKANKYGRELKKVGGGTDTEKKKLFKLRSEQLRKEQSDILAKEMTKKTGCR